MVAVVLLLWMFWPEATTPKLDQRTTWERHLRDAERRRPSEIADHQPAQELPIAGAAVSQDDRAAQPAPKRRSLAKPSELADRIDGNTRARLDRVVAAATAGGVDGVNASRDDPSQASQPADQVVALPEQLTEEQEAIVYSSEALDNASAAEQELDAAIANRPPEAEEFAVQSEASAHVRRRPRDDAPSWLNNAAASSFIEDRPVIAVVIDDLGLNRSGTRALNALPGPMTLAFLPYAGNLAAQTQAARDAGHELMVHMPMEPFGSEWPGPEALLTSLDHDQFVERLEKNLNRIEGYVGVNNHMGSKLTSDPGRMDLVMRILRERDVLFLDSKTSARSVAADMANRNGVPNTYRDVFLDHVIDIGQIRRQMALVERIARRTGSAVAIGHPHGATIEALQTWLPTLAARGFALAPISAVVARRACDDNLLIAHETCGRYLQVKKSDTTRLSSSTVEGRYAFQQ